MDGKSNFDEYIFFSFIMCFGSKKSSLTSRLLRYTSVFSSSSFLNFTLCIVFISSYKYFCVKLDVGVEVFFFPYGYSAGIKPSFENILLSLLNWLGVLVKKQLSLHVYLYFLFVPSIYFSIHTPQTCFF